MLLLTGFVFMHYLTHNSASSQEMLTGVTKVTKFSSPSLSVAYYEPRILSSKETLNPAYPQMEVINKMDLVYVQ
jgi:hypothetical protein